MAATASALRVKNPYSSRPSWLYPALVVVVFSAFILYSTWVVLFQNTGQYGPYLSPFFSPLLTIRVAGRLVPPSLWVAWAPLAFRLTCYYYRKAYFRGYLWHPRSCATAEPKRGTYRGETRFWIFNNLHRYALYLILIQTALLVYDALYALFNHQQLGSPLGFGNLLMLVNVACLLAYTFGCHAFRHLVGGGKDCFSCHAVRFQLWRRVTVLNIHHETWAWVSMFTVWSTDVYIRLLVNGVIPHAWWN
ncbi:MAG TPA: hypothetical protein VNI34_00585 [Candidatus Nitrosotalea sp.]|nr:hypothetical protein [Candidatus Nitrosotalea sp.]